VQAVAFALGYLFLSLYGGVLEDLEGLLFGSVLGVSDGELLTLLAVAVATLAFLALTGRVLLFASVDEDVARAHGVPVRGLHVAFLLVLGLAVAATAQVVGVLLVFALLVAPAATAQQLTARLLPSLVLTVVIALLLTWVSLTLYYFTNHAEGFFLTSLALLGYAAARGWRAARRGRGHAAGAVGGPAPVPVGGAG
jgi:zinc/manganese transport system permease protein